MLFMIFFYISTFFWDKDRTKICGILVLNLCCNFRNRSHSDYSKGILVLNEGKPKSFRSQSSSEQYFLSFYIRDHNTCFLYFYMITYLRNPLTMKLISNEWAWGPRWLNGGKQFDQKITQTCMKDSELSHDTGWFF